MKNQMKKKKIKVPKFSETLFYLLPKEILIEIFEFLPLFDQSLLQDLQIEESDEENSHFEDEK